MELVLNWVNLILLGWAQMKDNYPVLCLKKSSGEYKISGLISGFD